MAFNLREGYWGIKHLMLHWEKKIFQRPTNRFLKEHRLDTGNLKEVSNPRNANLAADSTVVEGNPDNCRRAQTGSHLNAAAINTEQSEKTDSCCQCCGYAMLVRQTEAGWIMECCSGLPLVRTSAPEFAAWIKAVTANSLPKPAQQPILQE